MTSKRPETEHYDVSAGLPDSGYYHIRMHVHTIALGPDNLADRLMFHLPPHTRLHMTTADNEKHEAFIDVEIYGVSPAEAFQHLWSAAVNLGTVLRMEQGLDPLANAPRLIEVHITPSTNGRP